MKTMHKLKSLVAIAGAVALALSSQGATKKIGSYTWTYKAVKGGVQIGDGTGLAVSPAPTGTLAIPSKIGKLAVKSIGDNAFADCDGLVSVTIPKGVTSIGNKAFKDCDELLYVAIPKGVTSIGDAAFMDCEKLVKATLPATVKSIGMNAFWDCKALKTFTLPASVRSIGVCAFSGCGSLLAADVPKGVKSIAMGAFSSCTNLTRVTLPATVTGIGMGAFADCASLNNISIPSSVKEIGEYAFKGCTSLKNVNMFSGVTNIASYAFFGCSALERIVLPHSVTAIGSSAFSGAFSASGARTVYYEYYGTEEIDSDEDRFKELLTASGFSNVGTLNFVLRCKLTLVTNNKKYGTALISDDDAPSATAWRIMYDQVHLVAKPKKGCVFSGWYADKACKKPLEEYLFIEGDYRKKAVDIYMPGEHTTIYAKFITKAADKKALKFSAATKKLAKTTTKAYPDKCFELKIGASSASRVTYSAKGLPSGLSIDDETGEISGSPTKPGTFTATVTVKSAGGYKITQKVKLTVYAYEAVCGQYQGYARPGSKASDPPALLSFSVNSTGKVSGKVTWKDKSYSFTAQCSYSSPYYTKFSPAIKIGKTTFKPGVVTIYERDYCATAYTEDESPAFYACTKSSLFASGGPLEVYANNEGFSVTDEHDETDLTKVSVALQAKFKDNDTVTIAGTVDGKPVSYSTQLNLKQAVPCGDGSDTEFDLVVPVILYKYNYYRSFWFTFIRDSGGNVGLETPSIRVIDDIR